MIVEPPKEKPFLDLRCEEEQVHNLRQSRSREPEGLGGGRVARQGVFVEEALDVMPEGEHPGGATWTA